MLNLLALMMFVGYGAVGLVVLGIVWSLLPSHLQEKYINFMDIKE